jgi:hypothetical protein
MNSLLAFSPQLITEEVMGAVLGTARLASCLLTGAVVMSTAPAGADAVLPEKEFCQELKRVVAILERRDSPKELKGEQSSKSEWAARKNLPGMNDCRIVEPEQDRGRNLQSFLENWTGYECELAIPARKIDRTNIKNVQEFRHAAKEASLEARAQANKLYAQFDRMVVACLPGMPPQRSEGINSFDKGMPQLRLRNSKKNFSLNVELGMSRMVGEPLKVKLKVWW